MKTLVYLSRTRAPTWQMTRYLNSWEEGWPTSNPYLQKLVQDLSLLEKYQLREAEEHRDWGRLGGMVGLG